MHLNCEWICRCSKILHIFLFKCSTYILTVEIFNWQMCCNFVFIKQFYVLLLFSTVGFKMFFWQHSNGSQRLLFAAMSNLKFTAQKWPVICKRKWISMSMQKPNFYSSVDMNIVQSIWTCMQNLNFVAQKMSYCN